MNWWRTLTVAFWIFVGVMLAWQAYNFNNKVEVASKHNPEKHYFYNPGAVQPAAPKAPAPDVRKVDYKVIHDSPQPGDFTVEFTVKNVGNVAATAVMADIRPYRGILLGDSDNGHAHGAPSAESSRGVAPISDTDPAAQLGKWVTIPDLAPGQSSTNSVVFIDQPDKTPNEDNPQLDITFEPVKAK